MRSHLHLVAPFALLIALSAPVRAVAAVPDVQQTFQMAQDQFDRKDYAGALPLFRKVLAASGSPNARLYLARCLRELGQLAEAYDEMHATMREATTKAEGDSKYAPTRDSAAAEVALLEPKVGRLVIAWTGPTPKRVTLNGKPVAAAELGGPITVMPGLQMIVVVPSQGAPVRQEARVDGGQARTVTVSPAAAATATGPSANNPVDAASSQGPAESKGSGGEVRIAGGVVTGLGVVGLVLFAVGASKAKSEFSTLESDCGGARCTDPTYADVVDRGKSWQLIGNVSLGVGLAAVVAGTIMLIAGGPSEPEAAAAPAGATARQRERSPWCALDIGGSSGLGATLGLHGAF